ncbi:MAG TPA: ChaB family protein [Nitrososphaeraceae archaeon]|nr:ChaB family protein [Nitrososphaeraceae archaeon]
MTKKLRSPNRKESQRYNALSPRTKKQIDSLPQHAQHIFKKAHGNAVKQYQNPAKRRGSKKQSAGEVAHKIAWSAVKRKYKKMGDKWMRKE